MAVSALARVFDAPCRIAPIECVRLADYANPPNVPESGARPMTIPGFFEGTGMPDPGWWEALWSDPVGVLTEVGLKSGMTVVDLCSGDGWFTLQIARIAARVTAVDIDGRLLATTRARLAESGITNCAYLEADAYDVATLVREPVDFVFLANAFHGVPDRPRLAAAIRSILKPGGLFSIVSWHAKPREETQVLGEPRGPATELRMTPTQTVEAVLPSGLALVHTVEIPPYHYGTVFRR